VAIVIDPVATKTVRYCDHAVHPRPGSDGHLALGMARVILARRPVDLARVRAVSEGVDEYLALVEAMSMEAVVERTGLPRETIEWLALTYADTSPATVLQGVGLQQYTRGAQTYRLIAALGMLTGNVGVPGGGVNFGNWPWGVMRRPVALDRRTAPVREVPVSRLAQALAETTDPPVRVAFLTNTNLVNQMPDSLGSRAALRALDFVVVVDQFVTDTAECADLVLPSTTMLEEEDFLPSYGHLYMQLMQPVVPPQGECRSDLAIFQALAERLGFGAEMAGDPAHWIDEIAAPFEGISYASLKAAGGRLMPEGTSPVPWATGRFKTPSGRFRFPETFDDDPVLPGAEYPLHLVFLATEGAINSQVRRELQEGPSTARVHPACAAREGLAEGDRVDLVSARGRLPVRLALDPATREDTVVLMKGDWLKHGRGANVLTEPRFTAGTGTAYNQNFVRIEQPRAARP
jgi:anaerobic selenocysteine-containing dehydrogenase